MSKCYGKMQGTKGPTTRCGHEEIWAELKTWNGSVDVTVYADDTAVIKVNNLNVKINGGRMFAEPKKPVPLTRGELIKALREDLGKLFTDDRNGSKKDRTWLHSLMPSKRARELGPLINLLQKYKKELEFKLDTARTMEAIQ